MKVLSIIFSFYILGLSLVPCADGIQSDQLEIEIAIHQDHDEGEDHTHSDGCSPFCHCNCCQTVVLHGSISELGTLFAESPTSYPEYMSHIDHLDPDKLFQPPRV